MQKSKPIIQSPIKPPRVSMPLEKTVKPAESYTTEPTELYRQSVVISSGDVTISNNDFDCEFYVPFDDNVEADQAEITIYNLANDTINRLKVDQRISITAGYGEDTGVIFSGVITFRRTRKEEIDKVTRIFALDDVSRKEKTIENVTFAANTTASHILRTLCEKVGLPIAAFKTERDHTYIDEVTLDSELMQMIQQYAKICGVSAYVHKGSIYVRSLSDGDNLNFSVKTETGLISVDEFEEEETNEDYVDTITGYEIEMLLQHRIATAGIIDLESANYSGRYRIREGTHEYDGTNFITKIKVV